MRVAYICSLYPAVSHTFVLREVNALRARGVEVKTFSIHRAGPEHLLSAADREASAGTEWILPPRWRKILGAHLRALARDARGYLATLALAMRLAPDRARGTLWQAFYFAEAVVLHDACRRENIRHIHAHMGNVAADTALLAAALGGRGWSWSLTLHGPDELFEVGRFRLAEKVGRAWFVACISDFTRSQLMVHCPPEQWHKLHRVRVGIPLAEFTRMRVPADEHTPTILCLGRLVPQKGQAVLLDALAMLAARGRTVRLVLGGDGPTRPAVERRATELGLDVAFTGAVGQGEIRDLYEKAAIFCLPSFAEGLPTVLMEAMALGVPVISTRVNGTPELVRHMESGLLVTPARPDELAEAIEVLLEEPALAAALATAALQRVREDHNLEHSAARLHVLLASAPGNQP